MIGVEAPPELLGIHANMAGAEREPPLKRGAAVPTPRSARLWRPAEALRDRGFTDRPGRLTLYWLTNTAVSSARLYWENKLAFFVPKHVAIPVVVWCLIQCADPMLTALIASSGEASAAKINADVRVSLDQFFRQTPGARSLPTTRPASWPGSELAANMARARC
jgi:hypothetical protein